MPRREIQFLADHYYHIYNRGNNRQAIFFEAANYLYLLRGIKKYILPAASLVAYCLMPTHYHLLLRGKPQQVSQNQNSEFSKNSEFSPAISRAMMRLSVSYTRAVNKRFGRVGSLFQGQFQAKPVQQYGHLLNLCIYIHANPVKDGLVDAPEDWMYSNYLEWIGQRDGSLVDREFIQERFASPEEYRSLVMEYIKTRILPDEITAYLQTLET